MSKNSIKILFLICGIGLFVWVIQTVDMKSVGDLLWKLGWGFIWVLGIYGIVTWIDTLSWKYGFKPESSHQIGSFSLWRIRQIGESFNTITPFGTVGGEPIKAQLLKDHHGLTFKQGLASLVIARTTFLSALILFMIPGVVFLVNSETAADQFKSISVTLLTVFSTAIILFLLFQISGSLGKVTAWLKKPFPFLKDSSFFEEMRELDQLMSTYYRSHPGRLSRSIGYALLGWIVGLGELYVTLYFLGVEVSFTDLWIMEAVSQLIRVCSFFIPLGLGAQGGGLVLIFTSLGLSADLGLTVSFVRRIKELLWVGLGLLLGGGVALRPSIKTG